MTVRFVDPRAEVGADCTPYDLRLIAEKGVRFGLVANGFPDSVAFCRHLESGLKSVYPDATFRHYVKENPSAIAPAEMLDAISAESDCVLVAYGH